MLPPPLLMVLTCMHIVSQVSLGARGGLPDLSLVLLLLHHGTCLCVHRQQGDLGGRKGTYWAIAVVTMVAIVAATIVGACIATATTVVAIAVASVGVAAAVNGVGVAVTTTIIAAAVATVGSWHLHVRLSVG
jgi:hypothetical protein